MKSAEEQKSEIQTIRERNISINLSDADVQRICMKAGIVGLTVAELLESFIGDLVYGTYNNGSDERMYANQWFDRCWFAMDTIYDDTFLKYLIEMDMVEEVVDAWHEIKQYEHAETQEDKDIYEDEKDFVNETFSEYVEERISKENEAPKIDEAMETVIKWWTEYQQFLAVQHTGQERQIDNADDAIIQELVENPKTREWIKKFGANTSVIIEGDISPDSAFGKKILDSASTKIIIPETSRNIKRTEPPAKIR